MGKGDVYAVISIADTEFKSALVFIYRGAQPFVSAVYPEGTFAWRVLHSIWNLKKSHTATTSLCVRCHGSEMAISTRS